MRTIEREGVSLAYRVANEQGGTSAVLLHGWMGTSHTWRKVAPILAETHKIIIPDMRGYGASGKPDTGYDAVALAGDIAAILDAEGIARAHIVGHDMGALVALAFAGTYPDRAYSITYLDEPLVGYNLDQFTVYREETYGGYWHFGFNTAPGLAETLLSGKEQAFVDWIMPLMHAPNPDAVTADDRRIYADSLRAERGITGNVGWYRATFETARQLRAIGEAGLRVPLMAWGGEFGVPITHEQMSAIATGVRGGIVPGCGHLVPEEKPEFLAEQLIAFFATTEAM